MILTKTHSKESKSDSILLYEEFSKCHSRIQKLYNVSSTPELISKLTIQNTFICGKSINESKIIVIK